MSDDKPNKGDALSRYAVPIYEEDFDQSKASEYFSVTEREGYDDKEDALKEKLVEYGLSKPDAEILLLHIYDSFTFEEIARRLRVSNAGQVHKRLNKSLKLLKSKGFKL